MLKLRKYIKPFILPIVCIIALLYGQAMCELAMPDYMSNIVNVGIHAGGIENGIFEEVSEETMHHLQLFMTDSEQEIVKESYKLSDDGNFHLVNEKTGLKKALAKPEAIVMALQQAETQMSNTEEISPEQQQMVDMLSQLPEGADIFTVMEYLPIEKREAIRDEMNTFTESVGESTVDTMNATFVQEEYKKLGKDTDAIQNSYIFKNGGIMLLIALLAALASVGVGFLASRVGAGFARNIRKDVFSKVESFSSCEFNKFSTNTLITRTTNDIQQTQMALVMVLRMVIYAPIIGIGAVIKVIQSNANMSWIIMLVIVVILSIMTTAFMIVMPKFKILQKLMDRLNGVVREMLDGISVIRAFNNQAKEEEKFEKANQNIMKTNLFTARSMSTLMPLIMLVMNSTTILIIWVGSHQIDEGLLQIGDLMAFMQYAMQIIMAFMMITMVSIMLPRASVAANRVYEVLSTQVSIVDDENPESFDKSQRGRVEFKNVSFKYPGSEECVLKNISFVAKPGETTAFIGSTGSGKSTLINLVPRFYDVCQGQILVDGVDVRHVQQTELRDKIGYVPQKGMLFSGTIASNLRYGKEEATDEELMHASQIAQAYEFIEKKPKQFEDEITQQGTNVSGGQRQRLSIARALVKNPEIYIFDDTFSALDFKTDAKLRKELNALCKENQSTTLLVAQRISTIMHADQIIVLDEGKIAGIGTHKELLKTSKVYQEIAYSQLSKEELENE